MGHGRMGNNHLRKLFTTATTPTRYTQLDALGLWERPARGTRYESTKRQEARGKRTASPPGPDSIATRRGKVQGRRVK